MTECLSPQRWANNISRVLYTVLGEDRFPVNVEEVAREYSQQVFSNDPISLVKGANLPGFDGALYPAPRGKKGWGIFYNTCIPSQGRINFTLAHEFGHYLIHRLDYPDGITCSQQDIVRWDSSIYRQIEQQANEFAAGLLMPLDDFRRQIDSKAKPTLEDISACADRYHVSLIAATLRWLQYTERRSVLVVSRDGFVLWGRSSKRAFKTGVYFKTIDRPPIPVPNNALPNRINFIDANKSTVSHGPDVWFNEPCEETVILSDQYDFAISLLHLENSDDRYGYAEEDIEKDEEDTFDRMIKRTPGNSWLG